MTLHIRDQHVMAELSGHNAAGPAHRFVTGPLHFTGPEHTQVKLWTPYGEQTYAADRGKHALAGLKEGQPITVELNGQGDVVGFHR